MSQIFIPPPGTVAPPTNYVPPPEGQEKPAPQGEVAAWSSNAESKRPLLDLLHPRDPQPVAAAPPTANPATEPTKPKRPRRVPVAAVAVVVALAVGAVAYTLIVRFSPQVATTPPPSPSTSQLPSQSPAPSLSPTPTPSPTATPTPSPTPTPEETVTQPAQTPTPSHPQAVTVTSKSGLWLRNSPSSASRSNIIGWMPDGATVSVDSTGDFWWHGIYKGQPGYFASKYTQ